MFRSPSCFVIVGFTFLGHTFDNFPEEKLFKAVEKKPSSEVPKTQADATLSYTELI